MQFVFDSGLYKVARITGPQHNLLGIRISDTEKKITAVPLVIQGGDVARINESDVINQVMSGLAQVNQELSKQYFVSEVQFLPSDTYSSDVYELLTVELIKRIDSGGKFTVSD
ncbi:hypothetical protein HZU77_014790 [Neisseriaceae bacterium TC5R-5]|nr:hypothetical protein [Neisseriaceae bacterium TC5R-5]